MVAENRSDPQQLAAPRRYPLRVNRPSLPDVADPSRAVLVTGASAGIGTAFARAYAAQGRTLVLTARRGDRLRALAEELSGVRCEIVEADLADAAAPAAIHAACLAHGLVIDTLVNNAGYGVTGGFLSREWQTHDEFFRVMVTAPCELAHRLLPAMRERGYGRIINVASLAGLVPSSAGHTLYAASKSFLIRFSESLALELAGSGVHVCALCPGFTWTEFHDANGMRARMGKMPAWLWQSAEEVVMEGMDAVECGRARHVTGRVNRVITSLFKYLPTPMANVLIRRQARNFRDAD